MKELFTWLACHPNVTIDLKYMDIGYKEKGDVGNLVLTMSLACPYTLVDSEYLRHREIISIDLMLAAHCDDGDLIYDILDRTYDTLVHEKAGIINKAMDKAKELPYGYKQ